MAKILYKILMKIIKPFYGSGIGKYFPFNFIFKFYKKLGYNLYYKNKTETLVKTKYGFSMFLNKGNFIDDIIISIGEWEPNITNVIKNKLKKGDVFLDLGANIGYTSLLASKIVGEKGIVLSFEPSNKIYKELIKNIEVNNFKNIIPYNFGVGNENTKKNLYYNNNNPGGSSIINNDKNDGIEIVNIVKLDDFLDDFLKEKQINFIKMDIEGYEFFAIQGMKNILKQNNLKMIFEYSPKLYKKLYGESFDKKSITLLDELIKYGFNLFEIDYKGKLKIINNTKLFFQEVYYGKGQVDIFCEKIK